MRQRMHVAQLAVFDAEQVRVGRAAAAIHATDAEGAEGHERAGDFGDDDDDFVPGAPALSPKGAVQINDVYVDDRGLVFIGDRFTGGLYILEMNV